MDYSNKVILITSGHNGIGKELVYNFAKCKAKVIVTYHNHYQETLDIISDIKNKYNVCVDSFYLDLCQEDSISELYNYVNNKYGKIDILINNAALSMDSYYLDKTKKEFMKVLETNVVGTFLMIKYFNSLLDNGYIFNISSTDGIDTGSVYSIDYNVSKTGINMITKTIALDNSNKIYSICPNWVDTESTRSMDQDYLKSELKRVGQNQLIKPQKIFDVINEIIENNLKTGSIIRIDGDNNE